MKMILEFFSLTISMRFLLLQTLMRLKQVVKIRINDDLIYKLGILSHYLSCGLHEVVLDRHLDLVTLTCLIKDRKKKYLNN
jgi:hypothetical protein